MHPYMIEKLAAANRDELLSAAERNRQVVQARGSKTPTSITVRVIIARAVAAVLRAVMDRPSRAAARRRSSAGVRPAPW